MTVSPTPSLSATASVHEHAWVTESVHVTSTGSVRYVRCTGCPARRVELDPLATAPPTPVTGVIGSDPHRRRAR